MIIRLHNSNLHLDADQVAALTDAISDLLEVAPYTLAVSTLGEELRIKFGRRCVVPSNHTSRMTVFEALGFRVTSVRSNNEGGGVRRWMVTV
jgi:hypothetical protein